MQYEPTVTFRGLIWTHDPDGEMRTADVNSREGAMKTAMDDADGF